MLEIKNFYSNEDFEQSYIDLRDKEKRILSLDQIRQLPKLNYHPLSLEWKKRIKSTQRIISHIKKHKPSRVLDLGCGNGWLGHKIAPIVGNLVCMDINMVELSQAAKVLNEFDNVEIVCNDILENSKFQRFDMIILNACVQYFPDLTTMVNKLKTILSNNGTIQIFDSPFYSEYEISAAQKRSKDYFHSMNAEKMHEFYHHHLWEEMLSFSPVIHYEPTINRIKRKILNWIGVYDSPFPWIEISADC